MKISIITANYNYAQYIEEAINSVINQSYGDWELIIVDDGSSDNSVEIIKSYCEKDSRIRLFQHANGENKGLKETLLLGISHASGDWIAFLESDDSFTLDNLQQEERALSAAYDELKGKQIEAKIKEAEAVSNVVVIDPPNIPMEVSFPSYFQILLIAVIFGLIL